MNRHPLEKNSFFALLRIAYGFAEAIVCGAWLVIQNILGREIRTPLRKSHFLATLHYFAHDWPKSFWKFPTGIGIGRSLGAFLSFAIKKEQSFEKPPKDKSGFTLIETMVSVTLFAILLIWAFAALGNIGISKNLVEGHLDINEQLYGAIEVLATTIKEGGGIDYEEYFNRSMVGLTLSGGHYRDATGFGNYGAGGIVGTSNFWSGSYFCRSDVGVNMGTNGCFGSGAFNTEQQSEKGQKQRYGEYAIQFIDRNSDQNDDRATCAAKGKIGQIGDTDCNGNITQDDDDEDLGSWPEAFSGSQGQSELYLLRKSDRGIERLILRRRVERDPNAPESAPCNTESGTGSGCIGRLEMLRLVGTDMGVSHAGTTGTNTWGLFDGKIDTWECHPDYSCSPLTIGTTTRALPTGVDSEWVNLFNGDIDVRNIVFFSVPAKDPRLSWKEVSPGYSIAPYVRFTVTVGFGWERRRTLKTENPEVTISTSVTLDN